MAEIILTTEDWRKRTRRNRRKEDFRHKKRLAFIAKVGGYPSGAYWTDTFWPNREEHHDIVQTSDAFLKECGRGKASKFLKKQSDRKIRRSGELYTGSQYRKKFDFWWGLC